jgi:hypothetical protein
MFCPFQPFHGKVPFFVFNIKINAISMSLMALGSYEIFYRKAFPTACMCMCASVLWDLMKNPYIDDDDGSTIDTKGKSQ